MAQQKLDPGAVWMFAFSAFWTWFPGIVTVILYAYLAFERSDLNIIGILVFAIPIALGASVIIAWIYGLLAYHCYSYELRDDGFRKESGVIWKKYTTIPYDRIQNVDINRGVIARILGLSDLHIQTAGASGGYYGAWGMRGAGAEGRLPGVAENVAEQLRDELIRRAKTARTPGL